MSGKQTNHAIGILGDRSRLIDYGPARLFSNRPVVDKWILRNHLGNTTLDSWFSETGHNQWSPPLQRHPEDGEELGDRTGWTIILLDEIDGHSPPRQKSREHPKVCCDLDASVCTVARGEETACNGRAYGQ